jgi:hypothetical protein
MAYISFDKSFDFVERDALYRVLRDHPAPRYLFGIASIYPEMSCGQAVNFLFDQC